MLVLSTSRSRNKKLADPDFRNHYIVSEFVRNSHPETSNRLY